MTPDSRTKSAQDRWQAAAHAMQSGVAMEMNMPEHASATDPKHLRVGVNTALVDHSSLVNLLIRKGVITEIEYFEAIADGMEAEQKRYEANLSAHFGKSITLA